uniref:Putative salivary kunitz domain protein n=1 Tax=Ixodes ricinus TaxID=34613 RepID=A0A0K8RJI5_IXORI
MQKILQFIFVVSFIILACRATSEEGLPEKCFQPEQDPRCRANGRRYFLDEGGKDASCTMVAGAPVTDITTRATADAIAKSLPERCFQPRARPNDSRANGRRYFLDEDGQRCKLPHGCWGDNQGYYDEDDCRRHCEVGKN